MNEGIEKPILPKPSHDGITSRTALQTYLRSLLSVLKEIPATSPLSFKIKSFLMGFPLSLSKPKADELKKRVIHEEAALAAAHDLWVAHGQKAAACRDGWYWWSKFLLSEKGLEESFEILRIHPSIYDIPPQYKRTAEWVRAYVAYLIHHFLVIAPNAVELFYILQVIHRASLIYTTISHV